MSTLNTKQKILVCIGIIVVLLIVVYYFYTNFKEEESNFNPDSTNSTEIEEKEEILIHITGAVNKQGVIHLKEGARVIDAVEESGGLLEDADLSKINLVYPLQDGQKVYIPSINDTETEEVLSNEGQIIIKDNVSKQSNEKININTASQTELETLPGIGTSTAYSIIEHRKEKGMFNNIEEIKNVSGIGEAKFNQIKDLICIK